MHIFVSRPTWVSPEFDAGLDVFLTSIRNMGLIPRTLGSGELEGLGKDLFIKAWLKEMFDIWSKKLRGWEFTMLKIGTVLWAFSDLINIPLGW